MTRDSRDYRVELSTGGTDPAPAKPAGTAGGSALASHRSPDASSFPARPFIGVRFDCCSVYLRIYRNADSTAYEGRCPHCGRAVRFPVGASGTSARFFTAR